MSQHLIYPLLAGRLKAFAAAQSPALPVAWTNTPFRPPCGGTYLREHLMLSTPRAAAVGDDAKDYQPGIYQIDIMSEAGKGLKPTSDVSKALKALFPRGLRLVATDVALTVKSVSVMPGATDDTRYKVPVSINFYAYVSPA
ncbi:Bacteriophage related protein of unknown function [Humidesulfovibrio mexicanus]|uniref:DUF4128 domain-containing protein n=1 Tax=Humidesulfovibrio mexicanus TaxID=147047 RepID=A0A239AXP0_9BACT|nr:phage tail terminator-like protein [Humidesulfovibrio mexicanus]SNS00320.1 Bacteriophage related protein of unknown function [Humidesulfovibrio mexicanus]